MVHSSLYVHILLPDKIRKKVFPKIAFELQVKKVLDSLIVTKHFHFESS